MTNNLPQFTANITTTGVIPTHKFFSKSGIGAEVEIPKTIKKNNHKTSQKTTRTIETRKRKVVEVEVKQRPSGKVPRISEKIANNESVINVLLPLLRPPQPQRKLSAKSEEVIRFTDGTIKSAPSARQTMKSLIQRAVKTQNRSYYDGGKEVADIHRKLCQKNAASGSNLKDSEVISANKRRSRRLERILIHSVKVRNAQNTKNSTTEDKSTAKIQENLTQTEHENMDTNVKEEEDASTSSQDNFDWKHFMKDEMERQFSNDDEFSLDNSSFSPDIDVDLLELDGISEEIPVKRSKRRQIKRIQVFTQEASTSNHPDVLRRYVVDDREGDDGFDDMPPFTEEEWTRLFKHVDWDRWPSNEYEWQCVAEKVKRTAEACRSALYSIKKNSEKMMEDMSSSDEDDDDEF